MEIFPEEVLVKYRCKIDQKKLQSAPLTEWASIKSRAHSVEVLRTQIAQIQETIAACSDIEKVWEMRQNIRKLQEILRTIFPTVRPYLSN
jgi:hypothetical protein